MADEKQNRVSVTDAVNQASLQLRVFFPEAQNLLVEEVEISDDDRFWIITMGFTLPAKDVPGMLTQVIGAPRRQYKIFKIDRGTGEVRSMKIRETANV